MPRTHGYSTKVRTNAIGALIGSAIIAIGLISGSVNKEVFTCWVEQILLPNLPKESVVIMDNAAFHKGKDMQNKYNALQIVL